MSQIGKKGRRHPCFMDRELHAKLQREADKKHMSLYNYTNYLIKNALEVESAGIRLQDIKEFAVVMGKLAQNYKGTVVIAPFSAVEKGEGWRELGKMMGIVSKGSFENVENAILEVIKTLLEVIGHVEISSDSIKVVSPHLMSDIVMNNLRNLIEGLLETSEIKAKIIQDKGVIGLKLDISNVSN
ncbi:hypothetical protein GWK48_06085 [Metallosphaera tengchongensis]|uniref:Uncharacterized protein n=1 Tax=Metallosphaera tengchongensis TaxID=1532350 RepID=A0A6N0NVX4_9CREN|nr:hypothetical protein [Metallosphaera tengchongensis]QKR00003.1 hypothetical protein GWK48_06085 [Metallosphaera tengchongensis]